MTDRPPLPQRRAKRPARSLVPVLTTALASFLAVLAVLGARVNNTAGGLIPTAAVISHRGHTVIKTTASGRVIETSTSAPAVAGKAPAPITTHASGSAGGFRDE